MNKTTVVLFSVVVIVHHWRFLPRWVSMAWVHDNHEHVAADPDWVQRSAGVIYVQFRLFFIVIFLPASL